MRTIKYVHWQEDDAWLGYLEEYPDYWTQGETLDDLIEHLKDLYLDLSGGHIPPKPGSREAVLRAFGVFRDDGDLEEQLASLRVIRKKAGR